MPARPRLLTILVALTGLVAAHFALTAVGAQATTENGVSVSGDTLRIVLPDGQDDRVELSMVGPLVGIAHNGSAVLTVHGDCQWLEPRLIGCPSDRLSRVHIDTGDGSDVIDTTGTSLAAVIKAGAGNDTIHTGRGKDLVSGGPGTDSVSYFDEPTSGVRVSLDGKPNDGRPFEDDNIGRDVETVIGTNAKDFLTGNDGDNVFVGHGGADVIDVGGGSDVIVPNTVLSP